MSPTTVALFTGPSLSSEHVTQDASAARDGERYPGEGFGRESESSDSETEEDTGEKTGDKGVVFKVDDWIALSGNQEVNTKSNSPSFLSSFDNSYKIKIKSIKSLFLKV